MNTGAGKCCMVDYLVIERLSKRFSTHGNEACRDVSFDVGAKEFVALIGPSGCGKSTLLHIVAGLSAPSSGDVRLHGEIVDAPRPQMMFVFQQYTKSIFPWKTVLDNVCLGIKYHLPGITPRYRGTRPRAAQAGRPRALRRLYPVSAFRRHAAARGDRPRIGATAGHSADGRTLQCARRHDAGRAPGLAALAVAGIRLHHSVRDARSR